MNDGRRARARSATTRQLLGSTPTTIASASGVFDDLDGDGDLDLYVTNDFGRNTLYLWEAGRFTQGAEKLGLTDKAAGMGVSVADVDLGWRRDLVISNMHSPAGMRVTASDKFQRGRSPEDRADSAARAGQHPLQRAEGGGHADVSVSSTAAPGGWARLEIRRLGPGRPRGHRGAERFPLGRHGRPRELLLAPRRRRLAGRGRPVRPARLSGCLGDDLLPVAVQPPGLERTRTHLLVPERRGLLLRGRLAPERSRSRTTAALVETDLDGDGAWISSFATAHHRSCGCSRARACGRWTSFRLEGNASNMDAVGAELRVRTGNTTGPGA